jgi:hypothetical protein
VTADGGCYDCYLNIIPLTNFEQPPQRPELFPEARNLSMFDWLDNPLNASREGTIGSAEEGFEKAHGRPFSTHHTSALPAAH